MGNFSSPHFPSSSPALLTRGSAEGLQAMKFWKKGNLGTNHPPEKGLGSREPPPQTPSDPLSPAPLPPQLQPQPQPQAPGSAPGPGQRGGCGQGAAGPGRGGAARIASMWKGVPGVLGGGMARARCRQPARGVYMGRRGRGALPYAKRGAGGCPTPPDTPPSVWAQRPPKPSSLSNTLPKIPPPEITAPPIALIPK